MTEPTMDGEFRERLLYGLGVNSLTKISAYTDPDSVFYIPKQYPEVISLGLKSLQRAGVVCEPKPGFWQLVNDADAVTSISISETETATTRRVTAIAKTPAPAEKKKVAAPKRKPLVEVEGSIEIHISVPVADVMSWDYDRREVFLTSINWLLTEIGPDETES